MDQLLLDYFLTTTTHWNYNDGHGTEAGTKQRVAGQNNTPTDVGGNSSGGGGGGGVDAAKDWGRLSG